MSIGVYYSDTRHPRMTSGGGTHVCCYKSSKVSDDQVGDALKDCHEKAADELGNKEIQLVEWFWMPDWVGTVWRLA